MSVQSDWGTQNERYLAAVLDWLRLLLIQRAQALELDNPEQETLRGCNPFRHGSIARHRVSADEVKKAKETVDEAASVEPPPAAILLSRLIKLSDFEQSLLLLCAAMELDTRIAGLCALAHGNTNRPYPTFALARSLFDDPLWNSLAAESPLRTWRLIEIHQPGAQPLTTSALRVDERILHYIKGANDRLDERLARLVSPIDLDEEDTLPHSHEQMVNGIVGALNRTQPNGRIPFVQLLGSDGLTKQLVAQRAGATLDRAMFYISSEWIPGTAGELDDFIRLWNRESVLLPIGLYVEIKGDMPESHAQGIRRLLEKCGGLIFLDTRSRWGDLMRPSVVFETTRPTPEEQEAAWFEPLADLAPDCPAALANQFNLSLPAIQQIVRTTIHDSTRDAGQALWDTCLMYSRQRLDLLAQRVEAKAKKDDLILPENEKALLDQVISQVRLRNTVYRDWDFPRRTSRGLGLTALFAGESGTGKTMAAEVIANELFLNLYKIDLSTVVSKYVGETEKNLRALFDAAEYGGVILFFDEADALFGKRSEVKDSHDRYANIEINYLLQRMETFQGLAILATNMKNALDTAFLRRLRFVVNFPFPGREERKRIWEKVFPAPRFSSPPDLDFDWLARLNLTGGNIQTIALNAAFLAAQEGVNLDMEIVLKAAKTECRKLEKPINEADFQWKKAVTV